MPDPARKTTLEEAERAAQRIAQVVGAQTPPGWGFFLCLTNFADRESNQRSTYVSNLHRTQIPELMEELARRLRTGEGILDPKPASDPYYREAFEILFHMCKALHNVFGLTPEEQAETIDDLSLLFSKAFSLISLHAPDLLGKGPAPSVSPPP